MHANCGRGLVWSTTRTFPAATSPFLDVLCFLLLQEGLTLGYMLAAHILACVDNDQRTTNRSTYVAILKRSVESSRQPQH
jgi:hypothetical protein